MWKSTSSVFCLSLLLAGTTSNPITIGAKTVLVYRNQVQGIAHQFVLRIARFQPDIFLEWESRDHQGTVHIYKKAVAEAKKLTLSKLFDVGVDTEGRNVTTKWLSRGLYRALTDDGEAKVEINRIGARMRRVGERSRTVRLNREPIELTGVELEDTRGGTWLVLKDPDNPLVLEYATEHYHEVLEAVSTDPKNKLRWIKRLPPVK